MVKPPSPERWRCAGPARPREADRLSKPQPPPAVPRRQPDPAAPAPGNLAYSLLGAQVIK